MTTRREPRGAVLAPRRPAHAKMDHERRNHELLKRLASDTATPKTAKSVLGVSTMSRSLTEELEKGLKEAPAGQDLKGKARGRKKSELDQALKSFQRQTSSSMLKKSSAGDSLLEAPAKGKRDHSPLKHARRREASPGKAGNKGDKRGNHLASDNARRSDVFERLSKVDSNKSAGRGDQSASSKTRDRSPLKSGRRSPQEKNGGEDKHQGGRRTGVSQAALKPTPPRRKDVSPGKDGEGVRREAYGRRSALSGGGHREEEEEEDQGEDDGDASTEKQEQENVPETVDKDRDDPPPASQGNSPASLSPPSAWQPCPGRPSTHQERAGGGPGPSGPPGRERQRQAGSASQDPHLPRPKGEGQAAGRNTPSPQAASSAPARRASDHASLSGANRQTNDTKVPDTARSSSNRRKHSDRKPEPKTPCKTTTAAESRKKPGREEVASPRSVGGQQGSARAADGKLRRSKTTNGTEVMAPLASKSDVLQKVRQRVSDGHVQKPADGGGVRPEVVDDDKDVCEADKAEDEAEFYKISVQTRLVTYNNSTLVIKNTSKSESVGDGSDTEAESAGDHTTASTTLQTSSAGAAVLASADVEGDTAHAPPCLTESQQEGEEEAGELTRTRSVRRKLAQFVSKGKSFLSDVYSATQTRLEQYTRADSPCSTASSGDDQREDADSGYYSIPPPLVETNPLWVEDHDVHPASWLQENSCFGGLVRSVGSAESCVSDGSQERTSMAEPGEGDGGAGPITEDTGVAGQGREAKDVMSVVGGEDEDRSQDPVCLGSKVDEEWIKKNILCTCQCSRDRTAEGGRQGTDVTDPDGSGVEDASDPSAAQDDDTAAPASSAVDGHSDGLALTREATTVEASSRESGLDVREGGEGEGEREGEMCYCSCHDCGQDQLPRLPLEVQELLDADHARMWWTITGNFGNILPIDWSKTYTRQQYLPVLNLNEIKDVTSGSTEETDESTEENAEEEEEVAQDLDLHHLILNGLTEEPVKTAEEVIQEIDDIMQEGSSSEDECVDSSSSGENTQEPISRPFPPPLYAEKLKNMSVAELNESLMELELVIRQYSETLISQLALRDELEYEKELKNSFISLLLQVQNKRRNFNVEKKKQKKVGPNGTDPKYLTTVIPYDVGHGPPHNPTLQILIKILMAINEDSPTVPTLLTDYILKVLCPS